MTDLVRGAFDEVPQIDVAAAYDGDEAARRGLAGTLGDALTVAGFAYITGHQVTPDLVNKVSGLSRRFFALPPEDKARLAINAAHRGYIAPNSSLIVTSSVAKVKRPNQSESFMILRELPDDDARLLAGEPLHGPNQWPAEPADFRSTMLAYVAAMEDLSRRIVRLIALALGVEESWFDGFFENPLTWLRLLHYPPQPKEDGLFGSAPHTDYGFITLLAQDDTGGLQVRNKHGEWIDAPPIPGAFVLNVGDILMRWSNGAFTSTPHRVINLSGKDRYSQPFFFDPSIETIVEPVPARRRDAASDLSPVVWRDYVMERIERNYSYRKALA